MNFDEIKALFVREYFTILGEELKAITDAQREADRFGIHGIRITRGHLGNLISAEVDPSLPYKHILEITDLMR